MLFIILLSISILIAWKENLLNWSILDLFQKDISVCPKYVRKVQSHGMCVCMATFTDSRNL